MIIERYILRNTIGPFFFSMSVLTFVFIMDFILKYIDLFIGKGVPFHIVLQTFILSLGHMFALIIPMSVLPATLLTYGNLASENEITAMRATGHSIYRMMQPALLGGGILAVGLILYNNYVLPESNHKLMGLIMDINKSHETLTLSPNRFIDQLEGYTIYFRDKDDRTSDIFDVQIFKHKKRGILPTTIIAESGHLEYLEEFSALRIDLYDGELHEMPRVRDRGTYRRTHFKNYTMHIRDMDRSLQRSQRSHRGDREMSVVMMQNRIDEIRADINLADVKINDIVRRRLRTTFNLLHPTHRQQRFGTTDPDTMSMRATVRQAIRPRTAGAAAAPPSHEGRNEFVTKQEIETQINRKASYEKQINRYKVEVHKKFAIPFACIIFVLAGSPLAIRLGKSGMGMAIGLSVLFFMVYYVGLIGGENVADRGYLSPAMAMWAPNVIFGVMGVLLLMGASREQTIREWPLVSALKNVFRRNATANPR